MRFLDLTAEHADNLGDILTMRILNAGGADNGKAFHRFAKYVHRRDVPLHDKVRAWNYVHEKAGLLDRIISSPDGIKSLAESYPSDC